MHRKSQREKARETEIDKIERDKQRAKKKEELETMNETKRQKKKNI